MARVALYISNFTAGELSPRLAGRIDTKKYASGCKTLENMMVHVHGGATRRPGTYYIREVKNSKKYARLIPFPYSPLYSYILEFGDKYMRFYRDYSCIMSGTAPYEITTPYEHTDLFQLKTERVNAELYFTHPSYPPYKLHRFADTNMSFNPVSITSTPATWATGVFPAAVAFYEERLFYAYGNTLWGSVSQLPDVFTMGTADASALTYVTGAENIYWMKSSRKLMVGDYAGEWTFSSGSDDLAITPTRVKTRCDTERGSFDLQGIKVGSATLFLQRAGFKIRQIIYDFASDCFNADDITVMSEHITRPYQIQDWGYQREPDSVVWMIRGDGTLVGLTHDPGQEVYAWHRHITGPTAELADQNLPLEDYFESVAVVPYAGGSESWDIPRDVPYFIVNRVVAAGAARFVEYMMPDMPYWDERYGFFVDCGLSFDDYANIIACTTATPTVITVDASVTWQPGYRVKIEEMPDDSMTHLNNNFYTILATPTSVVFSIDADMTTATAFVAGNGIARRAISAVTGLDHLAGKTVSVLIDGAVQADKIVSTGGTITIDPEGCIIHAGLPYTSILEPMRPEGGSQDGTSQGKRNRIHDIMVRFYNTIGANIGSSSESIDVVPFRTPSDPMDNPPKLFSGDKILPFAGGWDTNGYIRITQEQPLPMTVLSISPRIEVND